MLQQHAGFTDQDEAGLVNLAKSGDSAAFEELVRRCYPKCKQLATSILQDSTEAEDITQNGCLKAQNRLHQFRGESTFATWLARIVINQARSVLRSRRRHRVVSMDETLVGHAHASSELNHFPLDPEQQLSARQLRVILLREIDLIPSIFRKIVILRDLREMPLTEIAAELNLPVPTVKTRLFRGRKELRSRMLKYFGQRQRALLAS